MADTPQDQRVSRLMKRWDALQEQRQGFDRNYLQPLQRYVLPRAGWFRDIEGDGSAGRARGKDIINGHAQRAHRILTAGMHGGLTSPYRQWFDLTLDDLRLAAAGAVQEYLEYCKRLYYLTFATTNFYREKHKFDGELCGPGTACMLVDAAPQTVVRFKTLTMGQYWLAEDHRGVVDTCYRLLTMTAEQMIDEFGTQAVGETVKQAAESGNPYERYQVLHVVQPRRGRDQSREDNLNMPFESIYLSLDKSGGQWSAGQQGVLRESGYQGFPYIVGRWLVLGDEVYGRAPGHDVLPEARELQLMQADLRLINEKKAKPPIKKPAAMQEQINDLPGGVTKWDGSLGSGPDRLYDFDPDTKGLQEDIAKTELAIDQAFFVDVFLMNLSAQYGQPPTAEEVAERRQEKLLILGPTVEGQDSETLQPLIDRVDFILGEAGYLPEPPPELLGQRTKVVLMGPLAQAQRAAKAQNIRAVAAFARELAEATAEVLDNFDSDEAFRQFVEGVGASGKLSRDPERVAAIRQGRAQELAAQRQAMAAREAIGAAGEAAGAAKTLGETDGEAISQLLEAMHAA